MTHDTVTARAAGVLFITATAASLLSTGVVNPVLHGSDYLVKLTRQQDQVTLGALFQLIAAFSSAGIAMTLYPVVRRQHQGLAIGSVGFRVMEALLYVVGAIAVLLLLALGQRFVHASAPSLPQYQTVGAVLRELRDRASLISSLAFYVGAGMYYVAFYRSRLIPRWLSGWGVLGVALGIISVLLVLFRATGFMSPLHVGLNVPIGVNEMVLAVWLIVKGFNSPGAAAPGPVLPATVSPVTSSTR